MKKMRHIRKFGEVFENFSYEGAPSFRSDQFDEFCEYVSTWEENNKPVSWNLYFPVDTEDSWRTKAHAEEVWDVLGQSGSQTINEGKQVGTLYHFTSKEGLKSILKSNSLKAHREYYRGDYINFISFTRNKNFHKKSESFNVKLDYRITLDGDKLSNNWKISPFAYIPGWDYKDNWEYDWLDDESEETVRNFLNGTGEYDEQEERIVFKDEGGQIKNIKNYILKIDKVSDLLNENATYSKDIDYKQHIN